MLQDLAVKDLILEAYHKGQEVYLLSLAIVSHSLCV